MAHRQTPRALWYWKCPGCVRISTANFPTHATALAAWQYHYAIDCKWSGFNDTPTIRKVPWRWLTA